MKGRSLRRPWRFAATGALILVITLGAGVDPPLAGSQAAGERAAPAAPAAPDTPIEDRIATHIAELGAATWTDREAATTALLEIGLPAIPTLRSLADHPDPEIRNRVDWLITSLLPPHYRVDLVRVEGLPGAMRPVEWSRTPLRVGTDGLLTSQGEDGDERKFGLVVRQGSGAPELELESIDTGIGFELAGPTPLGQWTLLEREEIHIVDTSFDRVAIERTPSYWLARLIRTEGEPPIEPWTNAATVRDSLLEGARTTLAADMADRDASREALGSTRPTVLADACRLLVALGGSDALPPLAEIPVAARLEAALALGEIGRADALEELHAAFAAHVDGLEPLEGTTIDEVGQVLTANGSNIAVELLLARFDESLMYWQHCTAGVLRDRLREPEFAGEFALPILDVLLTPERIDDILWEDSLVSALIVELEERIPVDVFAARFTEQLPIVLGDANGAGATRTQTMLAILHRLLRRVEIPTEVWFDAVLDRLASRYCEPVVSLCLDRRLAGQIDDASWKRIWTELLSLLASSDNGLSYQARRALQRIEALDDLALDDRRHYWIEHTRAYTAEGTSVRGSVDRVLIERFGDLEERPPSGRDDEAWALRGDRWRAKLEELPDEAFASARPEEQEPFLLTIAHLRTSSEPRHESEAEDSELVFCRTIEIRPFEPIVEIGPDLEDRSLYLEPYGAARSGMYRLLNGAAMHLDRPIRRNQRPKWRRIEFVVAEGRIGRSSTAGTYGSPFDSILYLERAVAAGTTGDDSAKPAEIDAALLPAPEDDDSTAYDKLLGRLLGRLDRSRYRYDTLNLIGELGIARARPFLAERLSEKPEDVDLARALIRLGDRSGQVLLLSAVADAHRFTHQILEDLLEAGVVGAIDPSFDQFENRDRRRGAPTMVLRALIAARKDPTLGPAIEESRLIDLLIASLADRSLQSTAVTALREITGIDHGYRETRFLTETDERLEAERACFERWRAWWKEARAERD